MPLSDRHLIKRNENHALKKHTNYTMIKSQALKIFGQNTAEQQTTCKL